ncbi:hypothetical protein BASA81_014570 [Batrachochytrium salamandrivorans]|nr:hypothetical protein BASA81_014570 [Batrachochytrium salamandrivorans]
MEHVSKIDRRTTKYGARFRITVPEDRQRNIIQRLERQSKQTHWRIRQNYRHRRPDQPRPTTPPPPLSRQILAVNVANISNKRPAIRHIVRNTRLWAISETCITSSKFRFTVPGFRCHPASSHGTWTQRNRPRYPIVLWWPLNMRLQRIVHSWGHGLTVTAVLWITDHQDSAQSMVDVIRQFDHFVCNAPARALLTSPRVDRQTAVARPPLSFAHPFEQRLKDNPCSSCSNHIPPSLSRSNRSNCHIQYWDVLADGATDNTDTDTDIHRLASQFWNQPMQSLIN